MSKEQTLKTWFPDMGIKIKFVREQSPINPTEE